MTPPMTPTRAETRRAVLLYLAVTETIREAGEVPSGTLYAALMERGCSLETYERIIGVIERAGLIRKSAGGLITWTGPAKGEAMA